MNQRNEDIVRPSGRDLTEHELITVAKHFAARPELWTECVSHDPEHRTYEQLLRDEHLDVWLLCWSRDHDTGFHDHDLSAGAVAVAAGSVREERLVLGRPIDSPISRVAGAGSSFSFGAADIHRVLHAGERAGGDDPRLLAAADADGQLHGRVDRATAPARGPPTREELYTFRGNGRRRPPPDPDRLRRLRLRRAVAIDKAAEEFGPRKAVVLVVSEGLDRVPFFGTAGVPVEPETMELLTDAAQKGAEAIAEKGAERARAARARRDHRGRRGRADLERDRRCRRGVRRRRDRARLGGLSALKHALLGSVSGAVAHHSKRSIFIAHSA